MATYKNILTQKGLTESEVKNIEREIKLDTYASIFNQYMKDGESGSISDAIPQRMLSLIKIEFDDEREMAEWENDNLFFAATDLELAIAYVRKNVDMERVERVRSVLASNNMELDDVDEDLSDEIYDLMEEYGADHDLAEGWWEYEGTTEDVLKGL
jgi:hypothetical protein|nr:MAG TPA: hypothetical protein [Caudoviricetes sp.]